MGKGASIEEWSLGAHVAVGDAHGVIEVEHVWDVHGERIIGVSRSGPEEVFVFSHNWGIFTFREIL